MGDPKKIANALLEFGKTIEPKELFPVVVPEAGEFNISNPYAFCIAVCLDRGAKADIVWSIPYDIYRYLGHLDPFRICEQSLDELADLFAHLPRKPRYINDAPRTIKELTEKVVNECNGDASKMWNGKTASEVNADFRSIFGVGTGIANMSVLLIEKAYGIRFSDLDRPGMDIKADVHTMRVLFRLGVSLVQTENVAIIAARSMNPEYPGELDGPLWIIGRKWCHASHPICYQCPMNSVCQKVGVN